MSVGITAAERVVLDVQMTRSSILRCFSATNGYVK